jgi:hypothetical protein
MEVLKSGDVPALVTNIEVMNILSKRIERRHEDATASEENDVNENKGNPKLRHRDFIEEKLLEYLHTTPCANVNIQQMPTLISKLMGGSSTNETAEYIEAEGNGEDVEPKHFDDCGEGYNLMDAEILQILNLMPTEKVESHLMIEQLENRLDDDRQDQMLQLISEYSGNNAYTDALEEEIVEEEL